MEPTSRGRPLNPSSSALLPAMTASDGFDFEAQYEDAKHSLKFFDEAILKKKDLERALHALESAKSEKSKLQEHKEQAEAVPEEKRQKWRELYTAHDKKQQEWRLRGVKAEDVVFRADNYFDPRCQRGNLTESQIGFAKENLRLLEERQQVDNANAALDGVCKVADDWQARIIHQDEKIESCEEEILEMKKTLDDAVEQWKEENRIRNQFNDSDLILLKSSLKDQGSEIASLRKQICLLKETCESDKKTITSLQTKIVKDEPLLKVGMDILRRKQEMVKPKVERDMAAVERGNKAAHFGSALADASRVLSGSVAEERTWYSEFYCFPAGLVLLYGPSAPTFVEVIDWHAAVKNFQSNVTCNYSNMFITQFKLFVDDPRSKHMVLLAGAVIETYLKDDEQGKNYYKSLRLFYKTAYNMHKKRRASN